MVNKIFKSLFVAFIILLAVPISVHAATYYVSNSGNDSNPGTESQPWKTITQVNSKMSGYKGGDSVLFRKGDIWFVGDGDAISLKISASGSLGNPITFGSYGTSTAMPKLDGSKTNSNDYGVVTIGDGKLVSNIVFENLEILNGYKQNVGISNNANGNATNITVQNCSIHSNRTSGYMAIYINNHNSQGATNNIKILNNNIYDSKWNCMRITGGSTDSIISGNRIYNCTHNGIDTDPDGSVANNKNFQITNNTIYNFANGATGAGIYLPGTSSFTVSGNKIYDSISTSEPVYGIKVGIDTTFPGFVEDNVQVEGNVIWNIKSSDGNSHALWFDNCTNCSAKNNTLCANSNLILNTKNSGLTLSNNNSFTSIDSCTSKLPSSTPVVSLKTGDVNGDGAVNVIDIGILIDTYGKGVSSYPKSDVNNDGIININDIGLVIDNYGK